MNSPTTSKINWTALAIICLGILVTAGVIPPQYEAHINQLVTILMPTLIIVFRTWYTGNKE